MTLWVEMVEKARLRPFFGGGMDGGVSSLKVESVCKLRMDRTGKTEGGELAHGARREDD